MKVWLLLFCPVCGPSAHPPFTLTHVPCLRWWAPNVYHRCVWSFVFVSSQLNISYPATAQQKVVEIDDERKLYVPLFVRLLVCVQSLTLCLSCVAFIAVGNGDAVHLLGIPHPRH